MTSLNTCPEPRSSQASYWLMLGAVACLISANAFALDPDRPVSQYVRDQWGVENGFPRGPVYAFAQTPDGYLWIGTQRGLVRFDGMTFSVVDGATRETATGHVLGLVADREGSLWLRLRRPTLLRYRDGEFRNVMPEFGRPKTTVAAMSLASSGSLLLWVLDGEGSALLQKGSSFEAFAEPVGFSRSPVLAMAQLGSGEVWLGTRDAGVFRLMTGNKAERVTDGLPDLKINCLFPARNGDLWIGTDDGIVRWNGSALTSAGVPRTLDHTRALAMTGDRDVNLWVGTNAHGLIRVNQRGTASMDIANRTHNEAVTAVFEDREGNLWVGSDSRIERLRDSAFVTYGPLAGSPSAASGPVFPTSDWRTWVAPLGGGLRWIEGSKSGSVTAGGLAGDIVYSIAGGPGELWLGRQRGGLTRLRTAGGTFSAETYTTAQGLAQNTIYSVHQSRDGAVWAGTLSAGVSRFQGGQFTNFAVSDGLAGNTVFSILEASDGAMWFATSNGLSSFSKGQWHTLGRAEGVPAENVNCLFEDSRGNIWAGTAAGLVVLSGGRVKAVGEGIPALQGQIFGVAEDKTGAFWMATASHVLRVNREDLLKGTLAVTDVREYGRADGLSGVEGIRRHRSVIADASGRIWFSLNRGVSVVDPTGLSKYYAPTMVQIQAISADGTAVQMQGAIHVPADRKRVAFRYAGLSLSIPERVRFRYMLEGFDAHWSAPTESREAVYTNLVPRSYKFRVIASNGDGVWNSTEAATSFSVDPALWQTWWFRLSAVLGLGLVIFGLHRLRMHQLTRQLNVRFEERLAERTRIAQDLHDTLLQGFLSASMQLHVAADNVQAESPAKRQLKDVQTLMRQVIEEGRNAIRGLRSPAAEMLQLEQAFSRIQEELSIAEAIDFRVIVEGRALPVHPVLRDEIYRIGREALVNAFRHSHARRIEIELTYTPKQLRLAVRDDGVGIDPGVLKAGREGHWGLTGMRERAVHIGGHLNVWTHETAGTEVVLSIPGHIAFPAVPVPRRRRWFGLRRAERKKS